MVGTVFQKVDKGNQKLGEKGHKGKQTKNVAQYLLLMSLPCSHVMLLLTRSSGGNFAPAFNFPATPTAPPLAALCILAADRRNYSRRHEADGDGFDAKGRRVIKILPSTVVVFAIPPLDLPGRCRLRLFLFAARSNFPPQRRAPWEKS